MVSTLLIVAGIVLSPAPGWARTLADIFEDPRFARLELTPLAPALAATVASTYPVASASASVTYVYDPTLETFERQMQVGGPIIGERAETIGRGRLNVGMNYSYVQLATINGDELDHLVNRKRVNGHVIVFPVPDGVQLADGRYTNFLPVRVVADIDIDAQIATASLTYGVTADLDVNLTVPLVRTTLGVTAHTDVPDPRFPAFALPSGDPNDQTGRRALSDEAIGVGDVLLRAKYVLLRRRLVDLALGLGITLPTGEEEDFQGLGSTRVQPSLALSHVIARRVEPLLNVGLDLDAEDVGRSSVRWTVGGTADIVGGLTGALVFLGRHELEAQSEPIRNPFFFQIERNDIIDASIGLRYRYGDSVFLAANALVPLNEDGLRPHVIPTLEVEYAF